MDIGNKSFKNKEDVAMIIKSIGVCQSIKDHSIEIYNLFTDLFKRHPRYPEKTLGMIDIFITINPIDKGLSLWIKKKDGTTDNISYSQCFKNRKRDDFKTAMRVAIEYQIKQFRKNHILKCEFCNINSPYERYEVDHENHFEEILDHFLKTTTLTKPSKFQDGDGEDNRKMFTLEDKEYENEWKLFHESKARLRILCRDCNQTRPNWKG
jgi:hypothetical protein